MFLIGMIGFTSTASTPLMEANQKTSFVESEKTFAVVENVQTVMTLEFHSLTLDDFIFYEIKRQSVVMQPQFYNRVGVEVPVITMFKYPLNYSCIKAKLFKPKITIRNNC